jgi:hypothetical protein
MLNQVFEILKKSLSFLLAELTEIRVENYQLKISLNGLTCNDKS